MRLSDCSVEAVLFPKPSAPSVPLAILSSHLRPCLLSFMPLLSSSTDAALGRRAIWSDSSESQTKMIRGNIKNSDCFPQIKDIFLPFGQLYLPHSRLPRLRSLDVPTLIYFSFSVCLYPCTYFSIRARRKQQTLDGGWSCGRECNFLIFSFSLFPNQGLTDTSSRYILGPEHPSHS